MIMRMVERFHGNCGGSGMSALVLRVGLILALSAHLSACVTPPSGESRPIASVPTGVPERILTEERTTLVQMFGGEYSANENLRSQLRKIVDRVVAASDDPGQRYRVTILNSSSPNAFALPNGELYVTRGLLALANDTSELAAVIAHEVAHVTANHAFKRAELEKIARTLPDALAPTEANTSDSIQFLRASFSRAQELEADEIGIKTTAKAGYDPYGAARFLSSLARLTNFQSLSQAGRRMSFLSSHPATPQRISAALVTARDNAQSESTEADRIHYIEALNGLAYGEDPSGGVIRDRQFFHPRFDFAFTAPAILKLENSTEAVLGLDANGTVAMRLDIVRADTSPAASLAKGWIENIKIDQIDETLVSGYDCATGVGAGSEWTFRFAAIRKGSDLFRIIFAARNITPELDRQFIESIKSFRTLRAEERDTLRPLRLVTVTASETDSVETLVAQMRGIERPFDRFLILNGLDRPKLKSGAPYKLIAADE